MTKLERYADRTLARWQKDILEALDPKNDHAYMTKAEDVKRCKEQAREFRDTTINSQAVMLSHEMDDIKEKRDKLIEAVKVIINQAKQANAIVDREPLEREMAFARSLVNQLSDELTQARKRLVKHPRPKDEYFQYEVWFSAHHIHHMRAALTAYKPRGKNQKIMNERLLRRLRFAELLWKTDEELDNE